MNIEKYEENINNWKPENEEERNDQQKYIRTNMELRNLMTKEVLDDEVYERMLEETARNDDEIQYNQFDEIYISQSKYNEEINRINEIIKEIDNKYGFSSEQLNQEFEQEVDEKRKKLTAIQKYYEYNGSYIMRNIKVDELPNNEIKDMYEQIYKGIGSQNFDDMVKEGNNIIEEQKRIEAEQEREKRLAPIRERVQGYKNKTKGTDIPESQIIEQEDADNKIKKLQTDFERINKDINEISAKLILGEDLTNEVNEEIKKLDQDVQELVKNAQEVISDMDNFKGKYEQADFSMNYQEIKNELQKIKNKLKKLKQEQITRYNNSVEATNKAIDELRALNDPEINSKLDSLGELTKCDKNITQWNGSIGYLEKIDYNKLINANRTLAEIHNDKSNELKEEDKKDDEWSITMYELYTDIEKIEDEINRIESEFKENMAKEDINRLRQDIKICSDSVNSFRAKLENNRDKLDETDFNALEERCNSTQDELMDLNTVLNDKGMDEAEISTDQKNIYNELMQRINILKASLDDLDSLTTTLTGLMNKETVEAYRSILNNKHILELNAIEQEIENKNKIGKLDPNHYNNLKQEIENLKEHVKGLNEKLRDPGMIKDVDIFSILNGEIDGLETALDTLETMIESNDGKFKREQRKEIDKIIKHLENEHKRLTKLVEQYKESNPEKYNETIDRLNNVDSRLNKLKKDYRKKCPLLVRAVKSAKDFYKKHKKIILIAAGIAAFALVANHVLIPAIIHGNMQIWQWAPASRGTVEFLNKMLGSIGGLTHSGNAWFTASGVMLNGTVATSSLLKGLAISGINSAALISPLIIAVSKLAKKIDLAELKAKLKQEQEKLAEKAKKKKDESEEKTKENKLKKRNKKADKLTLEELAKLLKEYRDSGLTLDEFAEQLELTEEEKQVLQYLEQNSKLEVEKKKGGRK